MRGYLIDTITHEKVEFQYTPDEFVHEDVPEIASHRPIGSSSPLYQYVHGGERLLSFTATFHWQTSQEEVLRQVSRIRALTFPEIGTDGRIKSGPHPVILVVGDLYRDTAWIVKSVRTRFHSRFDGETGLPAQAEVNIVLAVHRKVSITYSKVQRF